MGRIVHGTINNMNYDRTYIAPQPNDIPTVIEKLQTVYVDKVVEIPVEKIVTVEKEIEKVIIQKVYVDKPFEVIKEVVQIVEKEVPIIKEVEKIVIKEVENIQRVLEEKTKTYNLNKRINKMWAALFICSLLSFILGRASV